MHQMYFYCYKFLMFIIDKLLQKCSSREYQEYTVFPIQLQLLHQPISAQLLTRMRLQTISITPMSNS